MLLAVVGWMTIKVSDAVVDLEEKLENGTKTKDKKQNLIDSFFIFLSYSDCSGIF